MKKNVVTILFLVIISALSLIFFACDNKSDNGLSASDKNVIRVGIFESADENENSNVINEIYGIRYANSIYNSVTIGEENYHIELVEIDDEEDKDDVEKVAKRLLSENVSAVIGLGNDFKNITASDYFEDAGIPFVVCSSTNTQVTNGKMSCFRICYTNPFEATVMAVHCKNNGYKNIAILANEEDDNFKELANYFEDACKKVGLNIVSNEKCSPDNISDALQKVVNGNPQFIYIPSDETFVTNVLTDIKNLNMRFVLGGNSTWESKKVLDSVKDLGTNAIITTFYDESVYNFENEQFINGFSNYLTSIDAQDKNIYSVSALGYDAYLTFYKAIEKAQSTNINDINSAVANTSFLGVTGDISFNSDCNLKNSRAVIKKISGNEITVENVIKVEES
ncbi:MAG: ABC transporter substrate-binding protein [Lachnospiraceae bacterium]|nr:ABC transporter substrate-binding protein [Lachnospiraceae bacterium]